MISSARRLAPFVVLSLIATGCEQMSTRSQTPDGDDPLEAKAPETEFIGERVTFAGLNTIVVQGVGLVTGLNNTGGDPPPSIYRRQLLDDMRRNGVKQPQQVLQDPSTALVLVRAFIPPVVKKGDTFDIELRLPENSEATSLNGGWLLPAYLSEQAIVPGREPLRGHAFAKAAGPILISTGDGDSDSDSVDALLLRGRVLGGGKAIKERSLGLYLRNDFRNVRNSRRIANRIATRFFDYRRGQRKGLAEAKTDQYLKLEVHPTYKNNYARYLQAVRQIALRENPVAERSRLERLKVDIVTPVKSEKAALQLEAIGAAGIPILKGALQDPSEEVRFFAAESLAYLGDSSGVEELAAAAKNEPAFRVFALAALAVIDEPATFQALRRLLNEPSVETRYGAFRALWTLDKNDPFIRGERLNDEFALHELNTTSEPLVHLTRTQHAEVVLFGEDQEFRTPLHLTAGAHIMINAQAGSNSVSVSRIEYGKREQRRVVSTRVADVIRAASELNASFPDIAQMLTQSYQQQNLVGRLEIDALPQAGRVYYRTGNDRAPVGGAKSKTRIGRAELQPNIYPSKRNAEGEVVRETSVDDEDTVETLDQPEFGEATLQDVSEQSEGEPDEKPEKKRGVFSGLFRRS